MQEDLQLIFPVIAGTIILIGLSLFVVFSAVQYRKSKRIHEFEKEQLKSRFDKEVLQVQLEVKEDTLQFVSEEIHDNIGQVLSLMKMDLYQLGKEAGSARIEGISKLLNEAISSLRGIAHMLSQNNLEGNNLVQLITQQVEELNRIGKFDSHFESNLTVNPVIDSKTILVVYRMLQELINNTIKYSEANNLTVILEERNENYELQVIDDGCGFDVSKAEKTGNGLQNLHRRAQNIGANLSIESTPDLGVKTQILIPKKRNE